jgi:zinc transport system substrate-binding protein
MKMSKYFILFMVFIVIFGIATSAVMKFNGEKSDKPKVAATIFPIYDVLKNIAGEELEVVLLLPLGSSPHTFDISPREVRHLSGGKILFAIGHGLDDWSFKIADSANVNKLVLMDKNIDLLHYDDDHGDEEDQDNHGDENDEEMDPHYWLSVKNIIKIAEQINSELSNEFPQNSFVFEANTAHFIERMEKLDEEIKFRLIQLNSPNIATFHNAWAYFSNEYPINIVTTFEEYPGQEPTARYLSQFQEKIREFNVKVVFSEPQFSPMALEPIANDLGVKLTTLDPLGGLEGRETYEHLMLYNVVQIENAFK